LNLKDMSLFKLASIGRWKPTWTARYRTPLPSGIQVKHKSWPHSQSLGYLVAQINFPQLVLAPTSKQKTSKAAFILSMLLAIPLS
jgi:hypothetical protein